MSKSNSSNSFVRVGKVKDAHGIRGELFIVLFAGQADWLESLEEIRLVNETSKEPVKTFALKSVRPHKNGLIVKSADIKDRNHAETLKGLLLEIPDDFLVSESGDELFLNEVLGFDVIDVAQNDLPVGKITKFATNGLQDLLVVASKNGEVEIPFVDAFVENIDYGSKRILMNLPEGLLSPDDLEGEQEPDSGEED